MAGRRGNVPAEPGSQVRNPTDLQVVRIGAAQHLYWQALLGEYAEEIIADAYRIAEKMRNGEPLE